MKAAHIEADKRRRERNFGVDPDRPLCHPQTDLAELRRCSNAGCRRFWVPSVQRWNPDARAYECAACGQLDHGG